MRGARFWVGALIFVNAAAATIAGRLNSWWSVGCAALVVAVLSWLLWWLGDRAAKSVRAERVEAASETSVALSDILLPTMGRLGHMSRENKQGRRQLLESVVTQVLVGAKGLVPETDRPRACYFTMNPDGRCLTYHPPSLGRGDEPKATFAAGTPEGDAALEMVKNDEKLFCYDVRDEPPPGWVQSERGDYLTFVSVAVTIGGIAYGMLTLDAKTPGSISGEDGEMLRVLARILAIAECLSN